MLRVGIIGTGSIGTDHARRIATDIAGARVSAVFDVDTDRAKLVAESVGAAVRDSANDLIGSDDVDAIVIASIAETHAGLSLACIAAGKPVMCEKPLAPTTADCLSVVEAEVALGRRLVQVGFMRRFDAGYLDLKTAIDEVVIGEPLLAHCRHRNPSVPPTFTSDMSLTDSVIHEIDVIRWLFGEEIVAVTSMTPRSSPLASADLKDPQLVLLETESGALVDVEVFVNAQYGYDVGCEVVGSLGTVTLETPRSVSRTKDGRRCVDVPPNWLTRFREAYRTELVRWLDGIRDGVTHDPSAWDGYAATSVAVAGVQSLLSGARASVALIDKPALYA